MVLTFENRMIKQNQLIKIYNLLIVSILLDVVYYNPLSANRIKWSNTLILFVGDVLDHFVGLALQGISWLVFKALKTGLICKGNPVHSVSR